MGKKRINTRKPPGPAESQSFESFMEPGWSFRLLHHPHNKPSTFNGVVRVRKYRYSVEPVEEPVEAIHERLRKLWAECDNYHLRFPLQVKAKEYGLVLDPNEYGKARKS